VLPERTPGPAALIAPIPTMEEALPDTPGPPMPTSTVAPAVSSRADLSDRQWLGVAWMVGVMAFACFAAVKAARTARWLHRKRERLPHKVQVAVDDLLAPLGLRKLPRMWLIEEIGQHFVWGALRGDIYLPADFIRIPDDGHRKHVLGHELSHVMRFDAAVNLLQIVAQAAFWFHPLVWWANKRIRAEREKCCDEMAIASLGAKAKNYSDAIVNILICEHESTRPVPSLAVAGPVKNIEERIKTMLRPGKKFYKRPSLMAVSVALLLALLTVPTALVLTTEAKEKIAAAPPPAPTAKDKAAATAALFRAIRDTDVERMRSAINQGADLEAKNKDTIFLIGDSQSIGCTPLYAAAGVPGENDNLIGLLLEAGANPNTRGPDGQIPLHAAVWDWQISVVELLVSAGSDVNAADKEGRTPAMIAFELGQTDMFDLMVGGGATVSTDLMSAYKGNLSRVQSLIENGKAQGRFEQSLTLLHAAAAGGHVAIVELLLTNGLDVHSETQDGYTALHHAAAGNRREVAELLLAKGADVNAEPGKQSALHWAIREQHTEMIDWLLARGANPNADGGYYRATPLHWAVWWGDVDTALLLVLHGGDIHLVTQTYPWSPLLDSVFEGDRAMTEALVTKTGDTKAAKWARLHAAVVSGNRQATERLLARGTDVNAKGERGFLALHLAAGFGQKDIVELLIEKGADVNAKTGNTLWDEGMTVLHGACRHGQKGVAELLIAKGADVNAKSKNGYVPLHVAATEGYRDVAELLIANSADINAKDDKGRTALSLAKEHGCDEIVELLRKHGAKEKSPTMPDPATPEGKAAATAALFREQKGDILLFGVTGRNSCEAAVGSRIQIVKCAAERRFSSLYSRMKGDHAGSPLRGNSRGRDYLGIAVASISNSRS
jgi:cytohesin